MQKRNESEIKRITNKVFSQKNIDPKLLDMPHYQCMVLKSMSQITETEKKPLRHMLQKQINNVKNVH